MRASQRDIEKSVEAAAKRQRVSVGRLEANVRTDRIVRRVLDSARDEGDGNEITFAIDRDRNVYATTTNVISSTRWASPSASPLASR